MLPDPLLPDPVELLVVLEVPELEEPESDEPLDEVESADFAVPLVEPLADPERLSARLSVR